MSVMDKQVAKRNLADIGKLLDERQMRWWLMGGTCLGAVREKDLIDHDPDTDIGIWPGTDPQDIVEALKGAGFSLVTINGTVEHGYEVVVRRDGVSTDIFWHYADERGWWNAVIVYGVEYVFHYTPFEALAPCDVLGFPAWLPHPVRRYLVDNYGKDWRIPNPHYSCIRDSHAL